MEQRECTRTGRMTAIRHRVGLGAFALLHAPYASIESATRAKKSPEEIRGFFVFDQPAYRGQNTL